VSCVWQKKQKKKKKKRNHATDEGGSHIREKRTFPKKINKWSTERGYLKLLSIAD